MESGKNGIDLICKAELEIQTQRANVWTTKRGGKGGGGMNWETGIDIHTLSILRTKQMPNENLLYGTGTLLMLCGDLNGKEIQKGGDILQLISFAIQP